MKGPNLTQDFLTLFVVLKDKKIVQQWSSKKVEKKYLAPSIHHMISYTEGTLHCYAPPGSMCVYQAVRLSKIVREKSHPIGQDKHVVLETGGGELYLSICKLGFIWLMSCEDFH